MDNVKKMNHNKKYTKGTVGKENNLPFDKINTQRTSPNGKAEIPAFVCVGGMGRGPTFFSPRTFIYKIHPLCHLEITPEK